MFGIREMVVNVLKIGLGWQKSGRKNCKIENLNLILRLILGWRGNDQRQQISGQNTHLIRKDGF